MARGMMLGTYTREKPCRRCGGHEFSHTNQSCVQCKKLHRRRQREPQPASPSPAPPTVASDVLMADFLRRKW